MINNRWEELVEGIYAAAFDSHHWHPLLAQIGEVLGGGSSTANIHFTKGTSRIWKQAESLTKSGLYYPMSSPKLTQPGAQQIVHGPLHSLGIEPGSEVLFTAKLIIKRTAFFNPLLKPPQWLHGINLRLIKHPAYSIILVLRRPPGHEPYTRKEVLCLRCLAPHLQRALQIHFRLAYSKAQRHNLETLLDSLMTATVLLDMSGQLIYINAIAERILTRSDGFGIRNGYLVATHRGSQATLSQAVGAPKFI